MATQRRTGGYYVPAPNGIFVFKGQVFVTNTGEESEDPPHDEPAVPPGVTATQFEIWVAPHNQPPR